jgi:hypothetical protein
MHRVSRHVRWWWFNLAAVAWSVLLIVVAFTVHNRGSASDPAQIFHSYTLVHDVGPVILILVGAPLVISLALLPVLHLKTTQRSFRAERGALVMAGLSVLWCLGGLVVQGLLVLPVPALIIGAVASAPLAARDSVGPRDLSG